MKAKEVETGKVYAVKVGDGIVPVKIMSENRYGGWDGKSLTTGRAIRIKTAGRLRYEVHAGSGQPRKLIPAIDEDKYRGVPS